MLTYPRLALCTNRSVQAKINGSIGEPLDWLTYNVLNAFGFSQLSFDFFIDWSNSTCQNRLWIKRILSSDISVEQLAKYGDEYLTQEALAIGDNLDLINSFSIAYGFNPSYFVFRDVNWGMTPELILRGGITAKGIEKISLHSLEQMKEIIRKLSGGPVRIGSKGLIYGTSCLECYLSTTDALWPGDVDLILWNNNQQQVAAIIELKKHTLDTSILDQRLSNYYPKPDGRKYDRLALLRDRLNKDIPIIILYYPTKDRHSLIKLELIKGNPSELKTELTKVIEFYGLTKEQIGQEVMNKIIEML